MAEEFRRRSSGRRIWNGARAAAWALSEHGPATKPPLVFDVPRSTSDVQTKPENRGQDSVQPRVRVRAERPSQWRKRASEVLTLGSTAQLREERNEQLEMLMQKGGDLTMQLLPVRLRVRMCICKTYLCSRLLLLSHTRVIHLAVIDHHCRWLEMLRSVVLTLVQVLFCDSFTYKTVS